MIVSDSTALIILLDLKRIDLLKNIFEKVMIPKSVYAEISVKKPIDLPEFIDIVNVKKSDILHTLKLLLDLGESEAIALAKELNMPIIIDEKKGRKIAKNLNIKIIGLLGIVYLNVKKGFITKEDAEFFLKSAVNHGYRIKSELVDEVLKSLD